MSCGKHVVDFTCYLQHMIQIDNFKPSSFIFLLISNLIFKSLSLTILKRII